MERRTALRILTTLRLSTAATLAYPNIARTNEESDDPTVLVPHYLNPRKIYRCIVSDFQLVGYVSSYSRSGCVGCSDNLRMANGVPLDDNRLTIACNEIPLYSNLASNPSNKISTPVRLINLDNGREVYAWVTDTGGFRKRIADLTPRTMNNISAITDQSRIQIDQLIPIEELL